MQSTEPCGRGSRRRRKTDFRIISVLVESQFQGIDACLKTIQISPLMHGGNGHAQSSHTNDNANHVDHHQGVRLFEKVIQPEPPVEEDDADIGDYERISDNITLLHTHFSQSRYMKVLQHFIIHTFFL
jgi:hypothetical protein